MLTADRRTVLAAGLAAAALPALPARAALPPLLDPRAISGDLDILAAAYAAMHPGLDRYLGRRAFADRIALLKRWAARPRSPAALFVELGRLTAAVRCGHSHPNPYNQSDAVAAALLDRRDRVPFAFRWIGGSMVVTRTFRPDVPLRPGMVIDRIDGIAPRALLARLIPLARADGGNDGKRRALMSVDSGEKLKEFDVYRPLVHPTRGDGDVLVEVDGRRLLLPAMTDAERAAASRVAAAEGNDVGWTFAVGSDGIGVLTMPNWAVYNSKYDWKAYLDQVADRLIDERARGLVIDLRANEGGRDCGDVLMERLIDRPLVKPVDRRLVRYRRAPEALAPYLDTWDKSFRDWGDKARPSDRPGMFQLVRDSDDLPGAELRPRGRRFEGPVTALVSSTCSSATFHFARLVKGTGRVMLVGEPTGGNLRGINGGAYFFIRLPATGMEVDLPLIGYFPEVPQPDAGVVPDVLAAPTRADIASGFDRGMAAAKASLA